MPLNVSVLLEEMLGAAKGVLVDKWDEIHPYAESEFKSLAEGIALIGKLKLEGKITEQQANILLEMKKNALRSVLLTVEGIGLVAAQEAINSALNIVKDTVNGTLNFPLL